ncbi:MAG: phosphotransferase [archaeon]
MKLTKKDFEEILSNYNIGNLENYQTIKRRLDTHNPSLIIETSKGKYFLKIYTKEFKEFRYHILKGLGLLNYLQKKNYPCVRVVSSITNKLHAEYKNLTLAVFEFMDYKEKNIATKKESYEIGKYLGRLHVLAKKFPLNKTGQGYNSFKKSLDENFYLTENAPKKYKEVLRYLKETMKNLRIPKNQPKSVCHVEFTSQHVRFKNQKLVSIIDWDEVSRDFMLYDLGTTAVCVFDKDKINFEFLAEIIRGYNNERKLTNWEKNHLYEAISFGVFKFVIWGLDEEEIRKSGWDSIGLQSVKKIMEIRKEGFDEELNKWLRLK